MSVVITQLSPSASKFECVTSTEPRKPVKPQTKLSCQLDNNTLGRNSLNSNKNIIRTYTNNECTLLGKINNSPTLWSKNGECRNPSGDNFINENGIVEVNNTNYSIVCTDDSPVNESPTYLPSYCYSNNKLLGKLIINNEGNPVRIYENSECKEFNGDWNQYDGTCMSLNKPDTNYTVAQFFDQVNYSNDCALNPTIYDE